MTSPQELILKLQNLLTNASGADLQQFLAGLEQPGPTPAGDDLTPDGRIKVAIQKWHDNPPMVRTRRHSPPTRQCPYL